MAKYKPGMFIKTPLGKMRVKMDKQWLPCEKCALYDTKRYAENSPCYQLAEMHKASCVELITEYGYLEKSNNLSSSNNRSIIIIQKN